MSKLEKLYEQALRNPGSIRFSDLDRLLRQYGFAVSQAGCGSSHFNYRYASVRLTIVKYGGDNVKPVYVREVMGVLERVRQELEEREGNDGN